MIKLFRKFKKKHLILNKFSELNRGQGVVRLNIGCGSRFHNSWLNIDQYGDNSQIFSWNILDGQPFPDDSIDVVYSAHVLEHFDRVGASLFLSEIYRILKPKGILRIVVPNLEEICKSYLKALVEVRIHENSDSKGRYEWSVIELLDQLVRHQSGGEMLKLWSKDHIEAENFIRSRIGLEFDVARDAILSNSNREESKTNFKNFNQLGKFRLSGEIHQWMYDEYSLSKTLQQARFKNIATKNAHESCIEDYCSYNLDIDNAGMVIKPDSLYMEGVK
jgi:predicted SAM-dependent methyltransferase